MANSPPSLEQIAAQLRAFSYAKGHPITEREWNRHPERLCGSTTVRRLFQQSWNGILRTSGITPRDPRSPDYVANWILAFYAQEQRWPQRRDFKRPCSHWVVKRVFRDADNAVAAAVQLAQDQRKRLTVEGIGLAEYLADHFVTVSPQPLPSTRMVPASALLYGLPTGYEHFPHAPRFEVEVVALFMHLGGAGRLRPRFIVESISPSRFPDCKAKQFVPGRKAYIDVWIEFEVRSADYLLHGHMSREERCDYIVCWEDNWPAEVSKPRLQILALKAFVGPGGH
jgi:hypothetical protein